VPFFEFGHDGVGTDVQDAGGVGGLVKVYDATTDKHYFPAYEGNGNVMALVDGSTGAASARYEYDPFGQTIRANGTMTASRKFRYLDKTVSSESPLVSWNKSDENTWFRIN
jgi:hypothetical protein